MMVSIPVFPEEEYERRVSNVRAAMAEAGVEACLISSPENVYYLTGLDYQGYFAYQLLILPMKGEPILVTRAMERATVRDQVPLVRHIGYSDGQAPPAVPPAESDTVWATRTAEGRAAGLRPWEMSMGVDTREPGQASPDSSAPVEATCEAILEVGLGDKRLGLEERSSFLPYRIASRIVRKLADATWVDISGMVEQTRLVQSNLELERTRRAAAVSDSMILAAIAAAGPDVPEQDVMAAIYDAMFRRGGTYPGFIPLVRSTRTIEHEHGTWQEGRLKRRDLLFLEMAGCVRRYHAPIGRLVFIGKAPKSAERINGICQEAMMAAAETIRPGVLAGDVYRSWQGCLDKSGLDSYTRHHCGYAVGIGYPPSWSGSGVPIGLRAGSSMELEAGMVFHLMSWLLRTGKGDSFLSDTVVVTKKGCEFLTTASRSVHVR